MIRPLLILAYTLGAISLGVITSPPLQAGSTEVKQAQELLAKLGYDPGEADGAWGGKTREALNAFQKDKGFNTSRRLRRDMLAVLKLVSAGAEKKQLFIAERVENTLLMGDGIRIYYAPDGKKIVRLTNGKRRTTKWRKKADGTYCEYLSRQKREVCDGNNVLIAYRHAEKWIYFKKDGKKLFEIELLAGNQLKP